jgi:3-phenylpropionate/trans-cinnamate dioxygenase ferredoxin reductase subunit
MSEVVVVGGGLAGATVAQTLREQGFTGAVTLIGAEPHLPYERPPLSKGYLLGTAERASAFVHPAEWYVDNDITLRTATRVAAIDRVDQAVVLDDGARQPYDHLVLATGSVPRRLTAPGASLAGVHELRRLEDADGLVAAFALGPRVVVVGGGWIGLEVAAAARIAGLDVTVLERGTAPLERVLGPEMGQVFADLHTGHGVTLRSGANVAELVSHDGRTVSGVRLTDGEVVPAEVVVVGIGAVPDTRLAAAAGLQVRDGVVVDEHLRTADPSVLAAGDIAESYRPALGRHLRVEHWANAGRQGAVAAGTILGTGTTDDRLPYFYTDQYDLGMEYVGFAMPGGYDDVVVRGDLATREFLAFWVRDGRVLAGMNVNVWDVTEQIEELIRAGGGVDDRTWPVGG